MSYSLALENRLQSVIPNGEVRTAVNLAVLRDKFMLQLLSNNPNLLEKSFNKPIPLGKGKVANKSVTNFAGKDIVDGKTVHFDMKFPVVPEKEPSQFITHYSGGVFVLIPTTPNAAYNYYVKVAETPKHRFYSFDPATIEQSIDLSLLTSGNTPLVHSGDIINGKYRTNPLVPIYEVGDVISAIDKLNSSSTELMTFRITNKAVVGNTGVTYTLHYTGKVDISKVSEAAAARKRLLYFTRERLSTTLTVPDVNAKNTDGTRKYIPTAGQKVLATLDIPTVKDDLPVDEQLELAASLINKVEALDKSVGYWVNSNILDNLKENVITRSKVSEALANQIGFKDPLENNNLQSTADDVNAFFIALKRTELIKQTLGNGNPITRVEGRSYTHTIPNNGTALGTLPGDLLYAGNKNYFYVYGVTKDVLQITQFPEAVFKLMEQENYTVEEFENIYSKIINC